MKLSYYPEDDALYIELSDCRITRTEEIAGGILLDFSAEGNLVGIDIDTNASRVVDLTQVVTRNLPPAKSSE